MLTDLLLIKLTLELIMFFTAKPSQSCLFKGAFFHRGNISPFSSICHVEISSPSSSSSMTPWSAASITIWMFFRDLYPPYPFTKSTLLHRLTLIIMTITIIITIIFMINIIEIIIKQIIIIISWIFYQGPLPTLPPPPSHALTQTDREYYNILRWCPVGNHGDDDAFDGQEKKNWCLRVKLNIPNISGLRTGLLDTSG